MVDMRAKSVCRKCGFYEACCEGDCGRMVNDLVETVDPSSDV